MANLCESHVDKEFFDFSTDAVFPHGLRDCAEDADMTPHAENLTDGYSQSKWVAEQLVLKAMERGLPAAVYRPGMSKRLHIVKYILMFELLSSS